MCLVSHGTWSPKRLQKQLQITVSTLRPLQHTQTLSLSLSLYFSLSLSRPPSLCVVHGRQPVKARRWLLSIQAELWTVATVMEREENINAFPFHSLSESTLWITNVHSSGHAFNSSPHFKNLQRNFFLFPFSVQVFSSIIFAFFILVFRFVGGFFSPVKKKKQKKRKSEAVNSLKKKWKK